MHRLTSHRHNPSTQRWPFFRCPTKNRRQQTSNTIDVHCSPKISNVISKTFNDYKKNYSSSTGSRDGRTMSRIIVTVATDELFTGDSLNRRSPCDSDDIGIRNRSKSHQHVPKTSQETTKKTTKNGCQKIVQWIVRRHVSSSCLLDLQHNETSSRCCVVVKDRVHHRDSYIYTIQIYNNGRT